MHTDRRRTLLAALLLAASAGLAGCGGDDAAPEGASPSSSASDATTETGTLALSADGSVAAKCAMPSAETLATFDTAFSGTVTSLDEGTATLDVDEWYAGGDGASTVTVESPSKALEDLLLAVEFEEGERYLVSATDTRVTLCGFTAEQTPELEALYDEAFGT